MLDASLNTKGPGLSEQFRKFGAFYLSVSYGVLQDDHTAIGLHSNRQSALLINLNLLQLASRLNGSRGLSVAIERDTLSGKFLHVNVD